MGCGPQIKLQQYDLIDSSEEEEDTNRLAKHVVLTTVNKGDRLNYVRIKIANILIQYGGIAVIKHNQRREELVCIMEYTRESLTFYTRSQKIGKTLTIKILPFQEPLFLTKKFDVFITYQHNALLLLQQIAVYNLDFQTNYFVVCTFLESHIPELEYMRMNLPNLIILDLFDFEPSYFLNVLLKFNKEIAVVTAICPLWILRRLFLVVKQQLLTFNFLVTDCGVERFITEFKIFEQLIAANAEFAQPPSDYVAPEEKYFNFHKFNVYNPENKTVRSFKFRFASENVNLFDLKEELLKEQIVPFNQQEIANQGLFITTQTLPTIVQKQAKKSLHFRFNSMDLDLGLFAMMDPNYKDQSMSFLITPHSNQQQQNGDEETTDQSERQTVKNHTRSAQNKFLIPKQFKPPAVNQPRNKNGKQIRNNSQSDSEESVQFAQFEVEKSHNSTFELSEDKQKLKYAVSPMLEMYHINESNPQQNDGQQMIQTSERVEQNSGVQITAINLDQGEQCSFQVGQEQQLDRILNQLNVNIPLQKGQSTILKNFEQDMISQHDETPALLLQSNYTTDQVVNTNLKSANPVELSYQEMLINYLYLRIKRDNGTIAQQELMIAQNYRTRILSYETTNVIQAFCEQSNIFESLRDKKLSGKIQKQEIQIAVYIKDSMNKIEHSFVKALIAEYQQNETQLPSLQLIQANATIQHIVRFQLLLRQYFEKLRTKRQQNTLSLVEMDQARVIKQMLDQVTVGANNEIQKKKARFQELRLKKQSGVITGEEMNEACALRKQLDSL